MTPPKAVEEEILDRFETLMRHAAGSHTPEFLGVDVTMPQAKVLYLVALRPDLPMSGIAAGLGVGAPAVSGLVDRLVALGYVERREDPADRRQQLVGITDAGTTALERLRELNANAMRQLIAGLDPEELEALRISLIALDREVQHLFGGEAHTDPEDRSERTSA